ISYGMGAYGLSRDLRITKEAAKNYIDSYFRKYPGVKTYMENIVREAREKGYVTTLLGRRRYVRGLTEKRGETYSAGERIAINTPIQGTSSDIIKVAIVRIAEELGKKKFPAHLLIQIHDELLFEVKKGREEEFITLVKPLMEGALKLSVPVRVDSRRGNNWFELE
ncbi:MAG TPA: DNA polymerase, partial [bacterium]|nr:DNA polymerase [bacterium]